MPGGGTVSPLPIAGHVHKGGSMEGVLASFGLKKLVLLAGLFGGAISAGLLPGPLAALSALWKRLLWPVRGFLWMSR